MENSNIEENKKDKEMMEQDKTEQVLRAPYLYICQIPGKQIRSKLSAAFNHWLQIPKEKMKIISEVIQMLHNASLLIDDIEDSSKLRRGIPVTHSIYGVPSTINSANYVYFLALEKLFSLGKLADTTRVFTEHLLDLHRGQGMDIYWRDSCTCPTEEEYKLMVQRSPYNNGQLVCVFETGGLFGLGVELMQLFSENKRDFKPLLDLLGLLFQIRDDYVNLFSAEYQANKSYCEDLTEGKFSFPIIHAIRANPNDHQVINILRQKTEDRDVKKYCVSYMERLGSFEYTKNALMDVEKQLLAETAACGDNPYLVAIIGEMSKVYREKDESSSSSKS